MSTILDCIRRIPSVLDHILDTWDETFEPLDTLLEKDVEKLTEIVMVGSGTSYTSATTAQPFVEKASGLCTRVVMPNACVEAHHAVNKNALYVFVSQTGTSKVVCEALEKLQKLGCRCVAMTQKDDTALAKIAKCHVCLNCGMEEFSMRTIGYAASVMDLMLLSVRVGVMRGHLSREEAAACIADAKKVPASHAKITAQAENWMQKVKRQMLRSKCIMLTGPGALYGVALEGAVKLWEMPQIISAGYELEEGLHGPAYGYDYNHCIVVLDDGGKESEKGHALARYMKDVWQNGLVAGKNTVDECDLALDLQGNDFACIEISAVVQVMAYVLAVDSGRDISRQIDHTVMYSYFKTHS